MCQDLTRPLIFGRTLVYLSVSRLPLHDTYPKRKFAWLIYSRSQMRKLPRLLLHSKSVTRTFPSLSVKSPSDSQLRRGSHPPLLLRHWRVVCPRLTQRTLPRRPSKSVYDQYRSDCLPSCRRQAVLRTRDGRIPNPCTSTLPQLGSLPQNCTFGNLWSFAVDVSLFYSCSLLNHKIEKRKTYPFLFWGLCLPSD